MTTINASTLPNLELANHVRLTRSAKRRELEPLPTVDQVAAEIALLRDLPAEWNGMKTFEFLKFVRRIGRTQANAICHKTEITPDRHLGTLTARERGRLIAQLEQHASSGARHRLQSVGPATVRELAAQALSAPTVNDLFER